MALQPWMSTAVQIFVSGSAFVVASALIFWPLEELLEGEKASRPKLGDVAALWFYQSYGLWIGAGIVFQIAFLIRQNLPPNWDLGVTHLPFWIQVALALIMAEIWVYTFHRLSHRWTFLWKFHRVHHTLVDMTWSASSRQHPVDFLLIIVGANLPAMLLGIDLQAIGLFLVLERFYTVLLHSNLNLDWGWFSKVIASPKLHARHHDPTIRGNYAGILSLLDVLGKTYQSPNTNGMVEEKLDRLQTSDEKIDDILEIDRDCAARLPKELKDQDHGLILTGE